jgi:hypothetical protein
VTPRDGRAPRPRQRAVRRPSTCEDGSGSPPDSESTRETRGSDVGRHFPGRRYAPAFVIPRRPLPQPTPTSGAPGLHPYWPGEVAQRRREVRASPNTKAGRRCKYAMSPPLNSKLPSRATSPQRHSARRDGDESSNSGGKNFHNVTGLRDGIAPQSAGESRPFVGCSAAVEHHGVWAARPASPRPARLRHIETAEVKATSQ